MNAELGVPTPTGFGIEPARWQQLRPLMAEQALASGSPGNNPRIPTADEIIALYDEVWGNTRALTTASYNFESCSCPARSIVCAP